MADWWDNLQGNLYDAATNIGDMTRYGVTTPEKRNFVQSQAIPNAPQPYLPTGEENPAAVRAASQYLGTRMWGVEPLSQAFNFWRYQMDDDYPSYIAGEMAREEAMKSLQDDSRLDYAQQQASAGDQLGGLEVPRVARR